MKCSEKTILSHKRVFFLDNVKWKRKTNSNKSKVYYNFEKSKDYSAFLDKKILSELLLHIYEKHIISFPFVE